MKYRGGERIGSFRALVDPSAADPVHRPPHRYRRPPRLGRAGDRAGAARVPRVLPWVGLRGAQRGVRPVSAPTVRCSTIRRPGPPLCTARLARRIRPGRPQRAPGDVMNYFRTRAKPTHRALDDAEACAEVLHGLLDLGGSFRHPDDGRPRRGRPGARTPHPRQDPARRPAPARPGCLPIQGSRRAGALRGRPTTCARG